MRTALSFLVLCLAASAAGADVVGLQWPENRVQRELFAYSGVSLRELAPTQARPTLEERLAGAPFVTGEGRVAFDVEAFDAETQTELRAVAAQAGAGAQVTFMQWAPVMEKLYGPRRAAPTLEAHKARHRIMQGDTWTYVDVKSLLTKARRRIHYDGRIVLEAAARALETGSPVSYPVGTWFLSEQFNPEGDLTEFHLIGKRPDHDNDYLLYDRNGKLGIKSVELNMKAPTTCFACHRNARRLTPFAEFPDPASTVAGFTPEVLVELTDAEKAICRAFAPTGPRNDDTFGAYAGLAAVKLKPRIADGTAPGWAKALWPRLVKLVPALGN